MIEPIARKLNFPDEAIAALVECERKMISNAADELGKAEISLFAPEDFEFMALLAQVAEKSGENRYVCDMVFLLRCTAPLYDKYVAAGYNDELFYHTMSDLRVKLFECKEVNGVWGMEPTSWFKKYYMLERFRLGRMQYDKKGFPIDRYKDILKMGDTIISCHIPSDGPLLLEDVKESLRMAYRFFPEEHRDGKLAVCCFSWLLFAPLFRDYDENTNIKRFYNLFENIENWEEETNSNFWHVFGVRYSPEVLENSPQDNSLRRRVIEHLKNGGTMGNGAGIIFVDENY